MGNKRNKQRSSNNRNLVPVPERINWTVKELWESGKYSAKVEKDRKQLSKRRQQRKAKHKKRLQYAD
jgi:hypothetical protein